MQYRTILFFSIIFFISTNAIAQRPIELDEVLIEHSDKKPKLKKFKYNGGHSITNYDLFFNYDNVYYLIDSLPIGHIQEITLYFSQLTKQMRLEDWKYRYFKSNKTEFEATIYEVNDDNTVGSKINNEPISIVFEEIEKTKLTTKKIILDLTSYNFNTHRFFIGLKKITDTNCDTCYYYAPELYKTKDRNYYLVIEDIQGLKKQDSRNGYRLKSEIKTLTSYY